MVAMGFGSTSDRERREEQGQREEVVVVGRQEEEHRQRRPKYVQIVTCERVTAKQKKRSTSTKLDREPCIIAAA